jgi:small subunit ribosomal protein S17
MANANIWNFKDPLKCGYIRLASSGFERYGTVIKSGFMRKTVTVRSDNYYQARKYKLHMKSSSKFQVHDEEEICKVGDKVVIRGCHPVSKLKHYYIRNIVWMVPRHNFSIDKFLSYEKRALFYNDKLRNSISLQNFKEIEKI